MKSLLTIVGVAALLIGLLWVGQGFGYVRWPASSFMIDQGEWTRWGGLLAMAGLAMLFISRQVR
jgi:hypothetical protein